MLVFVIERSSEYVISCPNKHDKRFGSELLPKRDRMDQSVQVLFSSSPISAMSFTMHVRCSNYIYRVLVPTWKISQIDQLIKMTNLVNMFVKMLHLWYRYHLDQSYLRLWCAKVYQGTLSCTMHILMCVYEVNK